MRILTRVTPLLLGLSVLVASSSPSFPGGRSASSAIVIDVDNTLYSEEQLKATTGLGLEEQIVRNTHDFCKRHFGMTPNQADDLYKKYGSTIEGLRHLLLSQQPPDDMKSVTDRLSEMFYHEVYDDIDMLVLAKTLTHHGEKTGYSHGSSQKSLLQSIASTSPVYLASNSPSWHVDKVLRMKGLKRIPWAGVLTPDSIQAMDYPFPTKASPSIFYEPLRGYSSLLLLDDSTFNIESAAANIGMNGIHVNHGGTPLHTALAMALGYVEKDESIYQFSDIRYLVAKNLVDAQSIHVPTWRKLRQLLQDLASGQVRIVDLGAGILSMLELVIMGHDEKELLVSPNQQLQYVAYEPNQSLYMGCRATLTRLGFVSQQSTGTACDSMEEEIFQHSTSDITVHLRLKDFTHESLLEDAPPHLIVGCCFADLMDPNLLVQSLLYFLQCFRGKSENCETLVYFPITFAGTTQFVPPGPFEIGSCTVPSDTLAFQMYAKALKNEHGHNLDPLRLVKAMADHGNKLHCRGQSNWHIDPVANSYFWNTMMYFFGTVAAPELLRHDFDARGWIERANKGKPAIVVSNADLLFSMSHFYGANQHMDSSASLHLPRNDDVLAIEEIQFIQPYQVGTTTKMLGTKNGMHLGPNDVEVQSVCSLISSGTELKIFKGLFEDAALDVNIKGMEEERMSYPLAYGYSLVGRVTRCGPNVRDADMLIGRLVFAFSPHASNVIADRDSLQIVPSGIEPHDAIFMPSVETALSLVHDANVRFGEKVSIYGQGLIGLLVTAILNLQCMPLEGSSCKFGTITAFDAIPQRLAAASEMGASEALFPATAGVGPFDVSVEVSGNAGALQSAVDNTVAGGRIVIGSWYGNSPLDLKLGIDFHRSHKTIVSSQVSRLRAELTNVWTKERRFAFTWDLVKQLNPSRLITKTTKLANAQEAYELLSKGQETAVCFDYNN